ncbi:MAG: 2-dehydropantoate 2-reductase [Actinobacteria bacterium]|nr:2-dehydropantoate 2-reductase [Actinomycetota bacterium]
MKLAVYGTGGVGGYFGGRLALAGVDVHLIARGAHLEALRARGLTVTSTKGDFHVELPASGDPAEIGPCDYVLFSVKAFDTEAAAERLGPLIGERTAVLSFQNGIDNEDKIARAVGPDHVMGGAAYIFSRIAEPGVIAHTGGPARLVFGEMDGLHSERVQEFLDACRKADIDAEIADDIVRVLWDKFAFICAQAGMTAAIRRPIGEVRTVEESWTAFRRIVEEVCALATAEGVELPDDTADRHALFAEGLEPTGYSSLYDDLTNGRRMELEALHGTIVRSARQHDIPVPVSETVYAILRPWAVRNEAASAPDGS